MTPAIFPLKNLHCSSDAHLNLHFEALNSSKPYNYRAPRGEIHTVMDAMRVVDIYNSTRLPLMTDEQRECERKTHINICCTPTENITITEYLVSLIGSLRKADIDDKTVRKCMGLVDANVFTKGALTLEHGDSQFHLNIQRTTVVSLDKGRVQELAVSWGTWVHFECAIPTGPNCNVKIRPIDNRNTFQVLAAYEIKYQERNRHHVMYLSPSIDMRWIMQATAMHARLQEGSPFKKKTLLEPRDTTKHVQELHHRHLMPLHVAPPQLLRFMCLTEYDVVSPSFATSFDKMSYEKYVHQEKIARDSRYTNDCNVHNFLYLVNSGPHHHDLDIPAINPTYNTCTFDVACSQHCRHGTCAAKSCYQS